MLKTARTRSMGMVAAALMALTTILVGFAHRPPALEARGYGMEVAAFVLPDGSLPELCHFDDVGGHDPGDHRSGEVQAFCDACLLTGAPGLGAVADLVLAVPSRLVVARLDVGTPALSGSLLPAPQSRGPPARG